MARYSYSPANGGFYHASIHAVLPPDAMAISDALHAELMQAISDGQRIIIADGQPAAAPPLPPSAAFLLHQLRSQRNKLLADSDFTQVDDAPLSAAAKDAWRIYRQQLRDLPETITDPAAILWPEPPAGESN